MIFYLRSYYNFVFTIEKEQANKLSFLDVLETRTEQGFSLSVYRKPTFSGQYLNFNSRHPCAKKELSFAYKIEEKPLLATEMD